MGQTRPGERAVHPNMTYPHRLFPARRHVSWRIAKPNNTNGTPPSPFVANSPSRTHSICIHPSREPVGDPQPEPRPCSKSMVPSLGEELLCKFTYGFTDRDREQPESPRTEKIGRPVLRRRPPGIEMVRGKYCVGGRGRARHGRRKSPEARCKPTQELRVQVSVLSQSGPAHRMREIDRARACRVRPDPLLDRAQRGSLPHLPPLLLSSSTRVFVLGGD